MTYCRRLGKIGVPVCATPSKCFSNFFSWGKTSQPNSLIDLCNSLHLFFHPYFPTPPSFPRTRKAAMAPPVMNPARTSFQWFLCSVTLTTPTSAARDSTTRHKVGLVRRVPLVRYTRVTYIWGTNQVKMSWYKSSVSQLSRLCLSNVRTSLWCVQREAERRSTIIQDVKLTVKTGVRERHRSVELKHTSPGDRDRRQLRSNTVPV